MYRNYGRFLRVAKVLTASSRLAKSSRLIAGQRQYLFASCETRKVSSKSSPASHGTAFTRADGVTARRLAVLIDGDNAQAKAIPAILSKVASYGRPTVKRIYADWTADQNRKWKGILQQHSIQPVQQFQNTKGKNAADIALIIDAMDLLHGGQLEGFCLVSSDSDFSRLASRLREGGHLVLGFGEKKTPVAFVSSCDEFVYTCAMVASSTGGGVPVEPVPKAKEAKPTARDSELELLLDAALELSREKGKGEWVTLSNVATKIRLLKPGFTYKSYGFSSLSKLLLSMPDKYEVKDIETTRVSRIKPGER